MKKIVFFLAVVIIAGFTTNSFAQKNRTLSRGFSISLITGLPIGNYGWIRDGNIDEFKLGYIAGLQIGSRWYFSPGEKFGAGLMVNWFDITAGYKSTTNGFGTTNRAVADVSVCEFGPIATFALSDDIALDAYYNLRPTGFANIFQFDNNTDEESYAGGGVSHAIGTAFRWNVLNVGLEFVLGSIKCSNTNPDYNFEGKFMINNIRIMLGVKF